jgi:HJR/Mrr/RecB family endonuclease
MKLTSEIIGQTGELEAALFFSHQGCVVTWPRSSKNPGYDFIAEKDGKMTKVQVKAGNSYLTKGGSPYVNAGVDASKCDVVYVTHIGTRQSRLYPAKECPLKITFPNKTKHKFDVQI